MKQSTGPTIGLATVTIFALAAVCWFVWKKNPSQQGGKTRPSPEQTNGPSDAGQNSPGMLERVAQLQPKQTAELEPDPAALAAQLEDHIRETLDHGGAAIRNQILEELAKELATNDPERARFLVDEIITHHRASSSTEHFVTSVTKAMANLDPKAAAKWAETLPENLAILANQTIGQAWVDSNPQDATQWISSLQGSPAQAPLVRYAAEAFLRAPSDPTASDWARDMIKAGDNPQNIPVLTRLWARNELENASSWALALPDPANRMNATIEVAVGIAETNPTQAIEWALSLPTEEAFQFDVVQRAAYQLDGNNPGAGTEFAKGLEHPYATTREENRAP